MQLIPRRDFRPLRRARAQGFTLLEVMVALVVTAIGLLGIAKIQALAYASTASASARSLVAIQAAGLAATMHANRNYWANGSAPVTITITGNATGATISDATLDGTATTANYCMPGGGGAPCTAPALAAFDLHTWANALSAMLPNSSPITTINCPIAVPITCTIQVTWNEKAVAVNRQAAANTGATTFTPTYILYVEP